MESNEETQIKTQIENILRSRVSLMKTLREEEPSTVRRGQTLDKAALRRPVELAPNPFSYETERKKEIGNWMANLKKNEETNRTMRANHLGNIKEIFKKTLSKVQKVPNPQSDLTITNNISYDSSTTKTNTILRNSSYTINEHKEVIKKTLSSIKHKNSILNSFFRRDENVERPTGVEPKYFQLDNDVLPLAGTAALQKSISQPNKPINLNSIMRRASELPNLGNNLSLIPSQRKSVRFSKDDTVLQYVKNNVIIESVKLQLEPAKRKKLKFRCFCGFV